MSTRKKVAAADEKALQAARGHAKNLERLTNAAPDAIVAALGLNKPPRKSSAWPAPSSAAWHLANILATDALEAAQRELVRLGVTDFRLGAEREAGNTPQPIDLTGSHQLGLRFGIPLLAALDPQATRLFTRWVIARAQNNRAPAAKKPFNVHAERFAYQLSYLIGREYGLWLDAKAGGAMAPQMPYAIRHAAMLWLWHPEVHKDKKSNALCLRCGALVSRRSPPKSEPLCPACMNEPRAAREWPEHAICPAGQGTWWLICKDPHCTEENAFIGRRDRLYCPDHKARRLTANNRRR